MNETDSTPHTESQAGKPVESFVLGLIGVIAWLIPAVGLSVTITGLVFGIKACRRPKNGLAIAGVVLCSIGLVLSTMNMAWGAYLGATGQHAIVNKLKGASSVQEGQAPTNR